MREQAELTREADVVRRAVPLSTISFQEVEETHLEGLIDGAGLWDREIDVTVYRIFRNRRGIRNCDHRNTDTRETTGANVTCANRYRDAVIQLHAARRRVDDRHAQRRLCRVCRSNCSHVHRNRQRCAADAVTIPSHCGNGQ
jgi:hypothetical protein